MQTGIAFAHKEPDPCFSYSAGKYRVLRLLPNDPYSQELLPKVYQRAIEFIDKLGAQTNKVWLGNLLFTNFWAQNNLIHVMVALDSEDRIVGHSICYVDKLESIGTYCQVLQIQKDNPEPEIIDVGFSLIDEWCRSLGITILMNSVSDEAHERLYKNRGFKRWRIVMQRILEVQ